MKKDTEKKEEEQVETQAEPKVSDEQTIAQKIQAGLTREQAEQVVKDQNENDKQR